MILLQFKLTNSNLWFQSLPFRAKKIDMSTKYIFLKNVAS